MTNKLYYYTRDIPSLFSTSAIDELVNLFNESHSFFNKGECAYPFNVKIMKDGTSVLEYSLAGFTKDDITLKVENDKLIVKAKIEKEDNEEDKTAHYVYKGIAKRSMVHTVPVDSKHHDLKSIKAEFEDGILIITIPQTQESKDANFEVKIK